MAILQVDLSRTTMLEIVAHAAKTLEPKIPHILITVIMLIHPRLLNGLS
jgi:hypothetical protein